MRIVAVSCLQASLFKIVTLVLVLLFNHYSSLVTSTFNIKTRDSFFVRPGQFELNIFLYKTLYQPYRERLIHFRSI